MFPETRIYHKAFTAEIRLFENTISFDLALGEELTQESAYIDKSDRN